MLAPISLYAEIFEQSGALDKLEAFASFYGADFYGLPRNAGTILLRHEEWVVPAVTRFGDYDLVPLRAQELLHWKQVPET